MDNILEKIHRAALKFLVPLTLEETYKLILEEAMELVKADYGSILLEEKNLLKRVYASNSEFYKITPRSEDIMHNVYKTQRPIILTSGELTGIAKIHPQIKKIGIHSDMIVALSYKDKRIGVITLMSTKKDYFTQKDIAIFKLFAPLASLAIRKTKLDESRNLTGNILDKIYKAALKFLVPLNLEETYALIVQEAIKLVKAQNGSIFLMEQGKLNRVYASDPLLYKIQVRNKGTTFNTFKTNKTNIIRVKLLEKVHPEFKRLGVKSIISIPLTNHGETIGVLSLQSTKSEYLTDQELDTLELFGSLASLAIRKTQLYDETKRALEARDLFISMAAHELRTPLTTISGYAQLLHSKLSGSVTPESRWVEELSWEAYRLTLLVNELLEVERIKTGGFHYVWKECSLKEIIKRGLMDFRFTHPEHKVIVEDKLDGKTDKVIGDHNKLLQVIINILDNAAKFSSINSEIKITLNCKSSYLILTIRDQGSGIAKKDISQIFEKFYRGGFHNREGMGIGLYLVKNIIHQHHGTIQVHSKKEKGTKIEIKLPMLKHE